VDIFAATLVRELLAQGYRAEIVQTLPHEVVSDPLPLPTDVPVTRLDVPLYATWRERWRAMRRYLEAGGPCVYVPNYDWRHSCISPVLAPSVKIVGVVHSDDPQHYEHVARLGRYWDGIVAVSSAIAAEIATLDPSLASRVRIIPYGVPVPASPPARRREGDVPLSAVYAGRLARYQKRVLDLPDIAAALRERGVASEMTVIGAGPDQGAFLAASAPHLVSRAMRYVGSLPNEDVLRVFAESDAFVLPSSFEGCPVSLLEAMAHGCVPVVASVRSGVPELVRDGVNGFVVPVGDTARFADRLEQLWTDESVRHCLSTHAYRTVRDGGYRVEEMAARYLALFERVIGEPYARPSGRILPPPELRGAALVPAVPLRARQLVWRLRAALRRFIP
jgi:glycosyltransferase involved in cell wall biosynthesis